MPRALLRLTICLGMVAVGPLSMAISPETGIPVFHHYTSDQYNAGPQNWA